MTDDQNIGKAILMNFEKIMRHYKRIQIQESILSQLSWDLYSIMPADGGDLREEQVSELSQVIYELEIQPDFVDAVMSTPAPQDTLEKKQLLKLKIETRKKLAIDPDFVKRTAQQEVRSLKSWYRDWETIGRAHV